MILSCAVQISFGVIEPINRSLKEEISLANLSWPSVKGTPAEINSFSFTAKKLSFTHWLLRFEALSSLR